MRLTSVISLTGRASNNQINLTGYEQTTRVSTNHHVRRFKTVVFDKFIGPLMRNDWTSLAQNYIVIDGLRERVEKYYKETGSDDLKMYSELLRLVMDMFVKHRYFENLGASGQEGNNMAKLVAMLPALRLRPEYEIYNLIIGEPDEDEYYDDTQIARIAQLIKDEEMTVDKIREIIV